METYSFEIVKNIFSYLDTEYKFAHLPKYITFFELPNLFPELDEWYFDYYYKYYHLHIIASKIHKKLKTLKKNLKNKIIHNFIKRKTPHSYKDKLIIHPSFIEIEGENDIFIDYNIDYLLENINKVDMYEIIFPYKIRNYPEKKNRKFQYKFNNIIKSSNREVINWDINNEIHPHTKYRFELFISPRIALNNVKQIYDLVKIFSCQTINNIWDSYLKIIDDPEKPLEMKFSNENMASFLLLFKSK